jgi:hypothetical protein
MVTIKPKFYSLVLVSNGARISRPRSKAAAAAVQGLDTVVKVDRFEAALDKAYNERSVAAIGKLISSEQAEAIARSLAALHVPATFDWAAKFGLPPAPVATPSTPVPAPQPVVPPAAAPEPAAVPPVCASCGKQVSAAVLAYCAEHAPRFGGRTLCYPCQRASGPSRRPA